MNARLTCIMLFYFNYFILIILFVPARMPCVFHTYKFIYSFSARLPNISLSILITRSGSTALYIFSAYRFTFICFSTTAMYFFINAYQLLTQARLSYVFSVLIIYSFSFRVPCIMKAYANYFMCDGSTAVYILTIYIVIYYFNYFILSCSYRHVYISTYILFIRSGSYAVYILSTIIYLRHTLLWCFNLIILFSAAQSPFTLSVLCIYLSICSSSLLSTFNSTYDYFTCSILTTVFIITQFIPILISTCSGSIGMHNIAVLYMFSVRFCCISFRLHSLVSARFPIWLCIVFHISCLIFFTFCWLSILGVVGYHT